MLSLLVLLALVGAAEICNLTRRSQNGPLFTVLNVHPTVRIVEGNWPEARLVPHVAGILLRQVLGYTVEYELDGEDGGANSSRMYEMLADEEADLALTLWPAKFWNTNRSEALSKACPKSSTNLCVATVGNQGYRARSGWFVSTDVSGVRGRVAEWSTVVNLYDHSDQLVKAHELDVVNQCQKHEDLPEDRYGGTYNCTDGSWVLDDSSCCPRAMYAHLHKATSTADLNTTSEAYNTACDGRPPCVALMVDDPTYDAGQNEAIAAQLAQPTRIMGEDGQFVGIQIVYGEVRTAIKKFSFEQEDKPLLIYSWLPRAEQGNANFTRITLESFYHCGTGDTSRLAEPIEREVKACDYPIEHVEKAVVWRLLQPSSTKAALFVNAFKLNAEQLNDLLEFGDNLNLSRKSTPNKTELDAAACLWLNSNTDTWEAWLPDFELYDTVAFQWEEWLIVCVIASLVGAVSRRYLLGRYADAQTKADEDWKKNRPSQKSSWPDPDKQGDAKHWLVSLVSCLGRLSCCKLINAGTWKPVLEYLGNAVLCLWRPSEIHPSDLVIFGFGQLFVGASNGLLEALIYSTWLTNGLNQLSLEVTISCAAWMLALKLFKWGFKSLPSGEQVVRRQLQIRLRIKCGKLKRDPEKDESFKTAIESTAETLAVECYGKAWNVFSEFLGFVSAIGFLFYYLFDAATPQDVSYLVIVAFALAPTWLLIVLVFGPLLWKRPVKSTKSPAKVNEETPPTRAEVDHSADGDHSAKSDHFAKDDGPHPSYPSYKTEYGGILWTCVYVLWAFGPILINPLKNDLGTGTNFVPLEDLLTVLLVLTNMGSSLRNLEGHLSTMARSSSKATEVAELLEKKPEEMEPAREEDSAHHEVNATVKPAEDMALALEEAKEVARAAIEGLAHIAKAKAEAAEAAATTTNDMTMKLNLEKAEEEARAAIKEMAKDLAKEMAKEMAKDLAKEMAKEMAKDETRALEITDAKRKAEEEKQGQTAASARWYHLSSYLSSWYSSSSSSGES